jgi:hypothetical protein
MKTIDKPADTSLRVSTGSFMDHYNSIRKPIVPATRVERPAKGGGYKRVRMDWGNNEN